MLISVVTPSFNQRPFLKQTLESVLSQRGDFSLEHIVVDGQSTDGSVQLLQSMTDPRLRWSSQADRGQSDAINRGLALAKGDVIGWLNSDDLYIPGALSAVAEAFLNPSANWVVGQYQIIDEAGNVIRRAIASYKARFLKKYSQRRLLRENFIAQPSVFWRRDFGRRVGGLDLSLHYTMDYDLWLRMGRLCQPVILPQVLSQFRLHSQSKSGKVNREQFDEGYRVAMRYMDGDRWSQRIHRFNIEKIVWAYRVLKLVG